MTRAAPLLATLAVLSADAGADVPRLRLTHEPGPRNLRMRPRTAAVPAPEPRPPLVATPNTAATSTEALSEVASVRDLERPISIRFNFGYAVDGAALSEQTSLNQRAIGPHEFGQLRAYALGEGYLSTRGVVLPSLSTYFASRFQLANQIRKTHPTSGSEQIVGPPIATWFERSGFESRAVWGELKDFLPDRRLAPLRVRAGELYVYGPWVLHMYGLLAAWEGKLVSGSLYGGSRVPDYTRSRIFEDKDRAGIGGFATRVDLRALKRPIPFAVTLEGLTFTAVGADEDTATNHSTLQVDWRPRKDFALIGKARLLDGRLANEHVQLRSRYKQVTNLVFDLTHRHDSDWRWDPSVPSTDPLAAQRYLDLGPVVPHVLFSGRAGTLIKENIDLLVRGAIARDLTDDDDERNTYAADYFEVGGAFEVRLRRTVAFGFSGLTRQTERTGTVSGEIPDLPNVPDPMPRQYSPELGERGFTELGTTLRLSLGARRLSALLEVYGRRTRYALTYCKPEVTGAFVDPNCMSADETGIQSRDYRGGGRITVDAWIGAKLRLFASYDVSTQLDFAREIAGFRSLRLMMEGVY